MTDARRIQRSQDADTRAILVAARLFDGVSLRGPAALTIENGRIIAIQEGAEPPPGELIELPHDWLLAPGLVDWQVNGGGGVLLNHTPTADGVRAIVAAHQASGTTSLAPTLITDAPGAMEALLDAAPWKIEGVAAVHLEGPFIDRARRGVHPAAHVRAMTTRDQALLRAFAACGRTIVTLAPEHAPNGAIEALARAGAIVSLGHSGATARDACAAADAGARAVTHLFNAMSQMAARDPGLVGAALADPRLTAGLIADGLHVDPICLRVALAAAGPDRLTLVSDAMPSVGATTASFELSGETVSLSGGRLTTASGTLAGAHLTLLEAVRRLITLAGAPLDHALRMATSTPAALLGLQGAAGSLTVGAFADLIALDADLRLKAVFVRGRKLNERREALDEAPQ